MSVKELWRPVIGHEGAYSVSNKGQVRRDASGPGAKKGRILKPGTQSKGYFIVNLSCDGVRSMHRVHRLVCAAFLGPCPKGRQVNHRDGIKTNNLLGNLEYLTGRQDRQHAADVLGCVPIKLNPRRVRAIRRGRSIGESLVSLARRFDVCSKTIERVIHRVTWKHVA